jgi:hypothetical protein
VADDKPRPLKADPRALEAIAKFEARAKQASASAPASSKTVPDKPAAPKSARAAFEVAAFLPDGRRMLAAIAWQKSSISMFQILLGLFPLVAMAGLMAAFPLTGILLGGLFLLYAAALWLRPPLVLVLMPVLLAVLDVSPWSGWWFFDEFDGVMLLTFAVLLVRAPLRAADFAFPARLWMCVLLLTLSYLIAASRILLPWPETTAASFDSYASPFNALRVAKGYFYILFLLPWCRKFARRGLSPLLLGLAGLVLAAVAVGFYVLIERWNLVGLLNLNSVYRSIGPFYSVHTGDGHIDVWFAATTPLVLALCLLKPRPVFAAIAAMILLIVFYGIVTTGSRGPFLAAFAGCAVAGLGLLARLKKIAWQVWAGLAAVLVGVALLPQLAPAFVQKTYLGKRFATFGADALHRENHWTYALSLRDDDFVTKLFGQGLGQFPALHAARADSQEKPVARFEFAGDNDNRYLRLYPGDPVYMQQIISVAPKTIYTLTYDVRVEAPDTYISIPMCQKWVLILTNTSDCKATDYLVKGAGVQWQPVTMKIPSGMMGAPHWRFGNLARAPVMQMIYASSAKAPVDIDNVRLLTPAGENILRNGTFEKGRDHWFWVTYNHETHHTKNLAVNILIDQGWFGLSALVLTLLAACLALVQKLRAGDGVAAVWLGALAGLGVVAITVSIFDAPRLTMLVYLLLFLPMVSRKVTGPPA